MRAEEFALNGVQVADPCLVGNRRPEKADQVHDRLEWIVEFVRNRGRHSAGRGDFFGLDQGLFERLALRNIAQNLGRPDDLSILVNNRRHRQRDVDELPGLGEANGLKVFDATARAQTIEDQLFVGMQMFRNDLEDG